MIKGDELVPRPGTRRRHKYGRVAGISGLVVLVLTVMLIVWKPSEEVQEHLQNDVADTLSLSMEERLELEKLGLTPQNPVIMNIGGKKKKTLHGRFLHITDMHPDLYYVEGSSIDKMCHRGKPSGKKDYAPRFGQATGGCDAPVSLINHTLSWIEENLRDKIDFVIWTGDNIRHDNDRNYPRTEDHIFSLNMLTSDLMHKMFGNPNSENPRDFDVIVVPSIGNNDVFPHNMLALGPTLQTREYYRIWSPFIPQDQVGVFHRGVCFVSEVIPGKLAVMSINTLYLFKSNPLVDTCDSKKEPGYQMLLWMGTVLEEFRQRGIKVWLSGHVPPIPKNMEGNCFHKFTLWTHEYRDIIIGGMYGHMNIDHFIPLDSEESWEAVLEDAEDVTDQEVDEEEQIERSDEIYLSAADLVHDMGAKPVNKVSYMRSVRANSYLPVHEQLEELEAESEPDVEKSKKKKKKKKKKQKKHPPKTIEEMYERYCIVNIAGSVIPTFNPSFRVWEYNLTGFEQDSDSQSQSWDHFYKKLEQIMDDSKEPEVEKKKKSKADKTIPKRMPANLPLGPGYKPQLFSPTNFVQYYADLETIDKEYRRLLDKGMDPHSAGSKAFKYQVEYSSTDEPYPMKGLLVRDFVTLASNLAENKTQWKEYMYRSFLSSGYSDD
ncbi:PPN1 (YDR452W) [Zygosaccharomyces parabailii]|nr:PPN1 (YDR452W) [Zygosaccharomyces parabailii]